MANPWFRLYSEFASDPKIQSMAEVLQRRLIILFCLRCGNVLETLQENEIAYALGITEEEWQETKQIFVSKCFIRFIKGKCNITNWNKRQFISDSSTDRVRKYRAKNATLPKRSESVTVTAPDTDSDSDAYTDEKENEDNMSRFKKPTLGEVTAYCLERKNNVNPNKWLDFYESKGWKIGKAPMKDWKAAVRTWENNDIGNRGLKVNTRGSFLDMEE
jgi:hypothetical protein